MTSEIEKESQAPPQSDTGVKRRGLLRFGTLMTGITGAAAVSALGADRAQAGPGDKPAPNTYVPVAEKGSPSGVATLDASAKIVPSQLPDLSATYSRVAGHVKTINVMTDFGAKGDGTTDDTAAIQAAINFAGPKGLSVHFPAPARYYKVTASLEIQNWVGLRLYGDGWETTEIRSFVGNGPLFSFTKDNTHSQTYEKLRLTTDISQVYETSPNSICFARTNTDGTSSLSGHYHHAYRDLKIIGFTYGFKVFRAFNNETTSTNPWWGCEWTRVFFSNIRRSCINLNLGKVGAPCNRFDQVKVFQNQINKNDGTEAAFVLRGEAVMSAIDVEQWHNQVINVPSGSYLDISGLHIEHHYVDDSSGGNRALYLANVNAKISGLSCEYSRSSTDGYAKYVIFADVNTRCEVLSATLCGAPSGAQYLFSSSTPSAKLIARNVNSTGFGSNVGLWTNGSATIQSLVDIEGMPPVLQSSDTLPTASATYRGRLYTQLGDGTTTADQTVQCMRSSAGTYSWKPIVSG